MSDKKKYEKEIFEFMFRINGNPICQRYFDIRNFNKKSINSLEMKEMMDTLTGINNGKYGDLGLIPKFLKDKSKDYLWGYYNPWKVQTEEDINRVNVFENEDIFTFEFRVDNKTVCESIFSGNYFPPKVRYQVNIKEIIPDIISYIREFLSRKNYTTMYQDVNLV